MHQQIEGSDGAVISLSLTNVDLAIDYRAPDLGRGQVMLCVAIRTHRAVGSAVIPFARNFEGSTVFLPFKADLFVMFDSFTEADACFARHWDKWKWSDRTLESDVKLRGARKIILRIPRGRLGKATKLDLVVYAKDLSENDGWGRFFGCIDQSVIAGHGDKYIPHYYELDLKAQHSPFAKRRGRLGTDQQKIRIYQLFVRLFGNTNETRKPNGSLLENGTGKFTDINGAALQSLREMGFSHIWLTGLLRQASGTDYSKIGQPRG